MAWDETRKGTVEIGGQGIFEDNTEGALKFLSWSSQNSDFIRLSITEYVVVSLALALAIAKFFPTFNNQIIARAKGPVHQSLYWGTIVVSNIFTYCLFFVLLRVWSVFAASILVQTLEDSTQDSNIWSTVGVGSLQEVVIHVILFVGALIASCREKNCTNVPLPTGLAKVVVRISFCCCFCCCCCLQCSAKARKTLIVFGLMNFLYRIIMDGITIVFLLFIEGYRAILVSVAFLGISFFVFLVMSISYVLFHCTNTNLPLHKKVGSGCQTLIVMIMFVALMLLVIMCIMIVFSLNLQGLTGALTGLIPSAALSAASWYLKKTLENDLSPSDTSTSETEGEATVVMNNLEKGEEHVTNQEMYILNK